MRGKIEGSDLEMSVLPAPGGPVISIFGTKSHHFRALGKSGRIKAHHHNERLFAHGEQSTKLATSSK